MNDGAMTDSLGTTRVPYVDYLVLDDVDVPTISEKNHGHSTLNPLASWIPRAASTSSRHPPSLPDAL